MPNIPKSWLGTVTHAGHHRDVLSDGGQRGQSLSESERVSEAASDEAVEAAVDAVTDDGKPGVSESGWRDTDADGETVGALDLETPATGESRSEPDDSGTSTAASGDATAADDADATAADDGDAPEEAETTDGPEGAVVLRAAGLEKTYGSWLPFGRTVEVLDGADIEIRAGEVVGIVGENGSGKSTLLQSLVGALEPDAGTVETSGRVGWCPQEELLYDRLTVRETFRLFGEGYGMAQSEVEDARDRLADRLDFEEFLDYRVDQLSGGNRQKVNLSVALLHDPDVLLLDEPYTGFDWDTYLAFWDLTEELRERGTAVAIISHLINEQERFDRIVELADGTLTDVTDEGSSQADDAGVR